MRELQERVRSERIKESARPAGKPGSRVRERDMPLRNILFVHPGEEGIDCRGEVHQYFQAAEKVEQTVSKQDYLRRQQNLNPQVFRLLNQGYPRSFYNGNGAVSRHGCVVLSADGSRAEIPNSQENRKVYGESGNQYGKGVARANISVLCDVYNRFIVDLGIHKYRDSEIEEAKGHIERMREALGERSVLIICDRNYVSLEFLNYLENAGVKYLIRLHKGD
ncbi:MAG: transposase [Spirochaetales bacterium]|nr:transposase [Spirochaetales bacterium]